ncbi:MAG: hypothetical protein ABJE95_29150, partial [Byssovorax sp.]
SPLLGFNNNVRHKGRVFHIQTEDSGVRHPHVITHLFADGGRILKTTKTSYTEHLGQPAMADTVRAMMQEQHKSMFIALRDGQFDYLFEEPGRAGTKSGGGIPAVAPPPASAPLPVAVAPAPAPAPIAAPPPPMVIATPPVATAAAQAATQEMAAVTAPPIRRNTPRPRLDLDPTAIHAREPAPQSLVDSAVESSIDLDLDALERAAAEAQTPFFQQIQDLPPPPAAVLGKRPAASGYSVTPAYESSFNSSSPASSPQVGRLAPPAPGRVPPPPVPTQAAKIDPASSGRYAPSRPAAIFATTRPPEGASIFGEDLISEKSLDEVILSYLAEDLEGPTDKK